MSKKESVVEIVDESSWKQELEQLDRLLTGRLTESEAKEYAGAQSMMGLFTSSKRRSLKHAKCSRQLRLFCRGPNGSELKTESNHLSLIWRPLASSGSNPF